MTTPRFAALRFRNFRLLWIGLLISHTGTWMASVGIGWLIYTLTGSPLYLGLNSLAFALPMIVLSVFGGVIADRVDRVRLLRITQAGMLLDALAMAALVHSGHVIVWLIIFLNLLEGVFLAFESPARQSLIPDLLDRTSLMSGVSLTSASFQSAAFVGPALAGLIIDLTGNNRIYLLFYLNAISFLAVIASLYSMTNVPPHTRPMAGSVLRNLREGFAYAWSAPVIRTLIMLSIISSLFSLGYSTLMPIFARDILAVGARGLGFLQAAPGAGTILGSLLFAAIGQIRHKGAYYVAANLIFCTCLAAFTLSRIFPLSMILLFVGGGFAATSSVVLVTLVQLGTPQHLRGRVLSLTTLSFIGIPSLGGMVLASGAAAFGAPTAILIGALIVAASLLALGTGTLTREGATNPQ
ncbi:MAG TPA: MFS transporter [bacterium]